MTADRRRVTAALAAAGAALGVVAGIIQASVGSDIPEWTGAKAKPGALGMLTVVLSLSSASGALALRRSHVGAAGRLLAAAALVGFTTVGRLWYLPGPLLLVAGILGVDSWSQAAHLVRRSWIRILLASLGGFEMLMAAGAAPTVLMVGFAGGSCLVAAAWLGTKRGSGVFLGLVAIGTLPFAALAWTALVPVLLLLIAAALSTSVLAVDRRAVSDRQASNARPAT